MLDFTMIDKHKANEGGRKMKHPAKVGLTIMMVLTLAFAGCQANSRALVAPHGNIDIDGVWGIPEQGTDREGANFDRWATGPGGSPSAVSDSDPAIQNQATNDENQIRYGAQDTNEDPPPSLAFADQSGFGFQGVNGISMPTNGMVFKLGTFTHYNSVTNGDLAAYNPLESVGLTITVSGSANAVLQCTITLDETTNDEVPCKFPDAPNDPPCGERVMIAPQAQPTTLITIEDTQYRLEIVGFADCQVPGFPNKILYTHEMAADKADLYAWLVAVPTVH